MAAINIPEWMREPNPRGASDGKRVREGFIEKNLLAVSLFARDVLLNHGFAAKKGLMQSINPSARVAGTVILMAAAAWGSSVAVEAAFLFSGFALGACSRVDVGAMARRIAPVSALSAAIFLPAALGLFMPYVGDGQGWGLFFLLTLRVSAIASFAALLSLTTGEAAFFAGLRGLCVPGFFAAAFYMTIRNVIVLTRAMEEAMFARKSRVLAPERLSDARLFSASRAGLFMEMGMRRVEDAQNALASRGFTGTLKTFSSGPLGAVDFAWLGCTFFILFLSIGA